MFYEVLIEKKANRERQSVKYGRDNLSRAKKIMSGVSEEDRQDLIDGKSLHDRGITDERAYRKDLRARRAQFGSRAGGVLGAGLGGFLGGPITGKPITSTLLGASAGAGLGGLIGARSVHRGKDNFYMNDVQRVRDLVKRHNFPELSDEDRTALYEEGFADTP
jgi:hypothetical protein